MKGVRVLVDQNSHKKVIQINVDEIEPDNELLEDLVDVILAEQAKDDEMIPWEEAKEILRKKGKL